MATNSENNLKVNSSLFVSYKKGNITKDYIMGKPLGSGSFGTVRLATHKLTDQKRAIKIIKKSEQEEEKFFLEVDILSKLSHPNIMQIYEFYDDAKNFYIISEVCPGGELFEMISERGTFTEKQAATLIKQIISAISYSHQNNIVHRDLKPENLLLDDHSEYPIIKIIDWGGARYYTKNKKMTNINGTPYYIAPEVLMEVYDEKCDIWSVGVILYILLCGYPPFNGENDIEIMKSVKKGNFEFPKEEWELISKDAKDLLSKMLKYDPKLRYSAYECLHHNWIKNYEQKTAVPLSKHIINNMRKFKKDSKLEQATIAFIVGQLVSKDERNKLLSTFQAWDKNSDGVLSKQEILEGFITLYGEVQAQEQVDMIMDGCDMDGSGNIDYNEFLAFSLNRTKLLCKQNLEAAFKTFDKDGSGKINVQETMHIFTGSTVGSETDVKVFETIVQEFDKNGDGEISLVEFISMMDKFIN